MNVQRFLSILGLFTVMFTAACGQAAEPTPLPTPEPTVAPTPVPTVAEPTPTSEPPDERPLVDVSHLLDFVREGIYKNSDGAGGAAWLDYDGDGFLDLYITNTRDAKNALFRNNGDGTFINVAEEAGVTSETGNTAVVAGDIDNDGCTDLILAGDGGFQGNDPSGFRVYVQQLRRYLHRYQRDCRHRQTRRSRGAWRWAMSTMTGTSTSTPRDWWRLASPSTIATGSTSTTATAALPT